MADDFRIQVAWFTSRKRRRLRRQLGDVGEIALWQLWAFAAQRRTDGDLTGMSDEDIADEAYWDGDPKEFVGCLLGTQLIDGGPQNYQIHDWEDAQPWVVSETERREKGKESAHKRHVKEETVHRRTRWCSSSCVLVEERVPNDPPVGTQRVEHAPSPAQPSLTQPNLSKGEMPPIGSTSKGAKRVLTHYLIVYPGNMIQADQEGDRIIRKWLDRGYTPDQLCHAVDGNKLDKWHQENKYTGLRQIFKNAEKIDRFIAQSKPPEPEDDDPNGFDALIAAEKEKKYAEFKPEPGGE